MIKGMNSEALNENLSRCWFVYHILHMVSAAKFATWLSLNRRISMNDSSSLTMKCVFITDLVGMRHILDTRIRNGKHTCGFNKYKVNDVSNQQDATFFVY